MDVRKGPRHPAKKIATFVFVTVFLTAAILQNVGSVARGPVALEGLADRFLGALGATQNWPMFGAYFPNHVRVPVVQLVLAGGKRVFLLPTVSPTFGAALKKNFQLEGLGEAQLEVSWRGNFLEARIEKYQSRASNPGDAWLGLRTAYAANQIRKWASANPDRLAKVRLVDLLSVSIEGPRNGRPARVRSVDPVEIDPDRLDSWPTQRRRQLFSPRP